MEGEKLSWYYRNREYAIEKAREYQKKHKKHYKEYYRKRYRSLNPIPEKKQKTVFVRKAPPPPKPPKPVLVIESFEAETIVPTIQIQTGIFTVRFD